MNPANDRRRYKETPSRIGEAHNYNQPCICIFILIILNNQ